MPNILIIEDNNDINHLLKKILEKKYTITQAFAGSEGKLYLTTHQYDVVLLDLMLPGVSGEALIQDIKLNSNSKIIVITAKTDINVLVEVLSLGADDYIAKPFNNQEVCARVDKLFSTNMQNNYKHTCLTYGELSLNDDTHEVLVKNKRIELTQKEYEIIKLLMSAPKRVFTKANIYEQVWQTDYYGDDNTISVHMSRLRSKLSDKDEDYIETVRGVGFRLRSLVQ